MLHPADIPAFLHLGYVPRVPNDVASEPWAPPQTGRRAEERPAADERQLVEEGTSALLAAFDDPGTGGCVIPLSGGLDSRAVLGGVLRHRNASEILLKASEAAS